MVIRSRENSVGAWTFLIGVILAIVIGISSSFLSMENIKTYNPLIYAILIILGLLVGFSTRIGGKESESFLIAGAIIIIVSKFGMESVTGSLIGMFVGATVSSTFAALLTLFVPATIVVALKRLFAISNI